MRTATIVCWLVTGVAVLVAGLAAHAGPAFADLSEAETELAREVAGQGWIVFAARSEAGDWDLFLCRPNGSQRRNITNTTEYSEAAPRFSPDGDRLLYRRLSYKETIDGNDYGAQGQLVLAQSNGASAKVIGEEGEWAWASWGQDGKYIACLDVRGIRLIELASGRVVRELPRHGFFQQMTLSPDGRRLAGVANSFGTAWTVAQIDLRTGTATPVSRVHCCTPDWFPDSRHLIFSNRPPGQQDNGGQGWTQLWTADVEGRQRRLVYGEQGRHVYGGCVSPDGRYVLFTGNMREDGDPQHSGAPMGLLRLADAPIIGGLSPQLRALHPDANEGPVLELPRGWEPHWTAAEIENKRVLPGNSRGQN